MTANTANVHKKYDALFRTLMADMGRELTEALKTENVRAIRLLPKTEFDCHGENNRIDMVWLTHAEIEFSIHYGGEQ